MNGRILIVIIIVVAVLSLCADGGTGGLDFWDTVHRV